MKLQKYLKKHNFTQQSFIDLIEMAKDVKIPQSTLAKWILDIRIPRKEEMLILYEITEGEVQPNDFYGIKPVNYVQDR
jgi:transcriptional regulator with XRE-family HTH domain